ncbi:MAG TPA: hypothetical protein VJT31_17990 [Rugosimonospora sp.]|nr:hypothetical protein [Rugosimonospora sp.]
MTNGTENLGNGAMTDERFAAHLAYRGATRRDTLTAVPEPDDVSHGDWAQQFTGTPLAEHPMLHGLLLELPPKGVTPDHEWLDRWFEAARSILELLYARPR